MLTEFHIGIDDTDSRDGGCTTYTATLAFQALCKAGLQPLDFPWLVRLNPNIPWKTRGNGALAIHIILPEETIPAACQIVLETVQRTSDISADGTDPSVTFLQNKVPKVLQEFSSRALYDVLSVREAKRMAKLVDAEVHQIKGTRGIIGSLAAIGAGLDATDHSFELIAYRSRERVGQARDVDLESVKQMDAKFGEQTFHNIDPETGRVLICSHGPDPVLLGIRGFSPDVVLHAFRQVRIHERIERIMIFRTNQGTDAHIKQSRRISDLRPYQSVVLSGRVETLPKTLRGGHVVFRINNDTGSLDCLAFEQAGLLRNAARELIPGDTVIVSGGVRHRRKRPFSLNLEKLEIVQLAVAYRERNPLCLRCGGRLESMGRNQKFRCKKCKVRAGNLTKDQAPLPRNLGKFSYIPPPRARRHLTRPNTTRDENCERGPDESSFRQLLVALGSDFHDDAAVRC
jgi:tRNA(Ile2)-agmatinylcytidine synthase